MKNDSVFLVCFFLIMLLVSILKIAGQVDISWAIILAPIYVPIGLMIGIALLALLFSKNN